MILAQVRKLVQLHARAAKRGCKRRQYFHALAESVYEGRRSQEGELDAVRLNARLARHESGSLDRPAGRGTG